MLIRIEIPIEYREKLSSHKCKNLITIHTPTLEVRRRPSPAPVFLVLGLRRLSNRHCLVIESGHIHLSSMVKRREYGSWHPNISLWLFVSQMSVLNLMRLI